MFFKTLIVCAKEHQEVEKRLKIGFLGRSPFNPRLLHAWYSEEAAQQFGYCIYLDEKGKETKITVVDSELDRGNLYGWKDKVYVGKVTVFKSRVNGLYDVFTVPPMPYIPR